MRIKAIPEDFVVEEDIRLPLSMSGNHVIYRVSKRDVTTLEVQERLARVLRVGKVCIAFPALKDKEALATQYVSVLLPRRAGSAASPIADPHFEAEPVGSAERPLHPGDLRGNRFTIVVRDLSLPEAQAIKPRLQQAAEFGVPNYFDAQRFGSYAANSGFIGKRILLRDAEGALRIYLAEKMAGDPERVRVFKEYAAEHWLDWASTMEHAPRPSNFRSVLTYLKDHPADYRRALNLVPPRVLALYLSAYQSYLWNLIAGQYIATTLSEAQFATRSIRVAGSDLPIYLNLPESLRLKFERLLIPLPNHRATYADPDLAQVADAILEQEGLTLNDFKARILKKAFATKSSRPLVVHPREVSASDADNDELARKRWKITLKFVLPPGSYATLVVRAATLFS